VLNTLRTKFQTNKMWFDLIKEYGFVQVVNV